MSDTDVPAQDEATGPPVLAHDMFLTMLVSMANDPKYLLSMTITLFVGGNIIAGTLTGMSEYLEGIAALIDTANGTPGAAAGVAEFYRKSADELRQSQQPTHEPNFIHLRDAQMISADGSRFPKPPQLWWRGRLSAVDGWMPGLFAASEQV